MRIKHQPVLLADAGPFCRFAEVGVEPLLAFVDYLGEALRITADVRREIAGNAKMSKFAALNQLAWHGWNPDDHVETISNRRILQQVDDIADGQRRRKERAGQPRREPWREKGEVATVLWAKANGWAVLVDDGDGKKLADRKLVTRFDTEELCIEMAAAGVLVDDDAFSVFHGVYATSRAQFERRLRTSRSQPW